MTEIIYVLLGTAAAAAGIFYWVKCGQFPIRQAGKKEILWCLGGWSLLCAAAWFLAVRGDGILLDGKLLAIAAAALAASYVDWEKRIISNRLVAGALAVRGLFLIAEYIWEREIFIPVLIASLAGAVFGFAFLFIISIASGRSIGFGDVKLFLAIGSYVGFWGVFHTLFYSALFCAAVSIVLLVTKKADRKTRIPFAPFIFLGLIITIILRGF